MTIECHALSMLYFLLSNYIVFLSLLSNACWHFVEGLCVCVFSKSSDKEWAAPHETPVLKQLIRAKARGTGSHEIVFEFG